MTAPLDAMVHHVLDTHHAFLHRELERLDPAMQASSKRLSAPWSHLKRVVEEHLRHEELLLFPALLAWNQGTADDLDLGALVTGHQADHDNIRTLEDALRQAARDAGPLEADLLLMLDDLVEHLRYEEEDLHPAVASLPRTAPAPAEPEPLPAPAPAPASPAAAGGRVVRAPTGVCPTCHAEVPAEIVVDHGSVFLRKTCSAHGASQQLLSNHPDYWVDLDRFYFSVNQESYPQRDFIVRMTEKCNLACPICLAKANTESTTDLDLRGLEQLLTERRGIKVDLMAAEPTLREDLADWIRKVKAAGSIAALHTNGLKLADKEYAKSLKEAGVDEVFLQFDGMDDDANTTLRGRPLLKARMATLKNLRELDIATSLIVVIAKGLNEPQVGETFKMALQPENDHIREVFFLGLRLLGSARHAGTFGDQALMPDELIDVLCTQMPRIKRDDVKHFNMIYFAMLSAFHVKKCLYVQHYLVTRDGAGGFETASEVFDLDKLARAASRYAAWHKAHPAVARLRLGVALAAQGLRAPARRHARDMIRLERLFERGMNLREVPRKVLLLGFITACDEHNFDSQVAINCGKGELSADGGFTESSAHANVEREARFAATAKTPGRPFGKPA